MQKNPVVILGIPIDNINLKEAVGQAVDLMELKDGKSHYVSTLNVNFLTNAHSWKRSAVKNPELLQALRVSDMVIADGMPILWLSYLLNCPLKERVAGVDFVTSLIEECAKLKKKVFFLGGQNGTALQAANKLKALFPQLIIGGVASPWIEIEEIEATNNKEKSTPTEDHKILSQINSSRSDLLLIAFGNPKQEIWFHRNRHKLQIPLSVGVGNTFAFIAGTVKRAPLWVQNMGLEWLYRLLQEPKRLWKRYVLDLFKFLYITTPLVLNKITSTLIQRLVSSTSHFPSLHSFSFTEQTLSILRLPAVCTPSLCKEVENFFENNGKKDVLLIDFSTVRSLSPTILGTLFIYSQNNIAKEQKLFFGGITPKIKCLMEQNRLWDFFQLHLCTTKNEIFSSFTSKNSPPIFLFATKKTPSFVVASFFGNLAGEQDYQSPFQTLKDELENHHCIIDLRYCDCIDHNGIRFLLNIQQYLNNSNRKLYLSNLSPIASASLALAKADRLFDQFSHIDATA